MRSRKYYAVASAACVALVLTCQLSLAPRAAGASAPAAYVAGAAHAEAQEEGAYFYFVVTYAENDQRVTNTFFTEGTNLRVYKKVRRALGDFMGDITCFGPFVTREEADQDKAANAPNLRVVELPDPLN